MLMQLLLLRNLQLMKFFLLRFVLLLFPLLTFTRMKKQHREETLEELKYMQSRHDLFKNYLSMSRRFAKQYFNCKYAANSEVRWNEKDRTNDGKGIKRHHKKQVGKYVHSWTSRESCNIEDMIVALLSQTRLYNWTGSCTQEIMKCKNYSYELIRQTIFVADTDWWIK